MTRSIGASKMSRVVGSFSQTYMPRNLPSIVCALAPVATKDPTTNTATLTSRLFRIEELRKDLGRPRSDAKQQHPAIDPSSGRSVQHLGVSNFVNVRFWPKADMTLCGAYVRF
jgi:hypothetical protein